MADDENGESYTFDEISKQPVGKVCVFCLTAEGKIEPVSLEGPLPVKRIPNTSDTAYLSGPISVGGVASVKIADANPNRKFISISTEKLAVAASS